MNFFNPMTFFDNFFTNFLQNIYNKKNSFLDKISCEEKSLRMMDIDLDWMNGTIG